MEAWGVILVILLFVLAVALGFALGWKRAMVSVAATAGVLGGAGGSTSREETHGEAFDALQTLAGAKEHPDVVWLVGPSAVGKTTLRYALLDAEGAKLHPLDVDQVLRRAGLFPRDPVEIHKVLARLYAGKDAIAAETARAKAAIADAIATAPDSVAVLEGAVQLPGRSQLAPAGKAETWLLFPKLQGSYPKTIAERLRFRAERLEARKSPDKPSTIFVPETLEEIPLADLVGLDAEGVLKKHAAAIKKAVAHARKTWKAEADAIQAGKIPGRVFEV